MDNKKNKHADEECRCAEKDKAAKQASSEISHECCSSKNVEHDCCSSIAKKTDAAEEPGSCCTGGLGGSKKDEELGSCCTGGLGSGKRRKGLDAVQRNILILSISAVTLVLSYLEVLKRPYFDFAFLAIILCGLPIIFNAFKTLFKKRKITSGLLVSAALIASVIIKEYFAAGEVALIMQIGGFLEALTIRRAQKGIKGLLSLTPDNALLKEEGGERLVPTSSLKPGDVVIVKAGENMPVDGRVLWGETAVNQAAITGESLPVDKKAGDEVFEGTLNTFSVIEVEVTRTGENSSIKKMARLVQEANRNKAPVVKIADRLASYLVPSAIAIAVIVGLITRDLTRAVTIMVVFCPCSLVLATPTAIMASVGRASKLGIIIKSGEAIEKLSRLDAVAFDKTGTITSGKLSVTELYTDMDEGEFLSLAASAERLSEHPISEAVVSYAKEKGIALYQPQQFKSYLGKGVACTVEGKSVAVGNKSLLSELGAKSAFEEEIALLNGQGKKALSVAVDGRVRGVLGIADVIKEGSAAAIRHLNENMKLETIMLTGDNKTVGEEIAKAAGITSVYADCLPEDKVNAVKSYAARGKKLAMVGDGVNDAPALASAYVGIAMGAMGSDIAVESADAALMTDDLAGIPKLINHADKTMRTIWRNIAFSMTLNVVAILLASFGKINPVIGALIHNAGSVVVVLSSALLYSRN